MAPVGDGFLPRRCRWAERTSLHPAFLPGSRRPGDVGTCPKIIVDQREQRMDLGINGKIAFVAGGSQGMGDAAASILAAAGCRVDVVARNKERIAHGVERSRSAGGMAIGKSDDIYKPGG